MLSFSHSRWPQVSLWILEEQPAQRTGRAAACFIPEASSSHHDPVIAERRYLNGCCMGIDSEDMYTNALHIYRLHKAEGMDGKSVW